MWKLNKYLALWDQLRRRKAISVPIHSESQTSGYGPPMVETKLSSHYYRWRARVMPPGGDIPDIQEIYIFTRSPWRDKAIECVETQLGGVFIVSIELEQSE